MQETKLNRRLDIGTPARIKQVSYPHLFSRSFLRRFLWIVGGLLLAATLLVPVFWIPGLVILVLPIEVYLLDWVHSKYSISDGTGSLFGISSGSKKRKRASKRYSESEKIRDALRKLRQPPFIR